MPVRINGFCMLRIIALADWAEFHVDRVVLGNGQL